MKEKTIYVYHASEEESQSNQGRWSADEHRRFIEAVNQFGREWDKVQAVVKTRSLAQVRSHAQKYFLKLSKSEDLERLHENELWSMSAQPMSKNLNAMVVLDIMGSILKKMKMKRDEMCNITSGTSNTDLVSETDTINSHLDDDTDVEEHDGEEEGNDEHDDSDTAKRLRGAKRVKFDHLSHHQMPFFLQQYDSTNCYHTAGPVAASMERR